MDFLKNWIATVAISSVITGIIILLSPSQKTARLIKLAASLYMVITVFSPFVNGTFQRVLPKLEGVLQDYDFSETETENGKTGHEAAKYAVEYEIVKALEAEKIETDFIEAVIIYQNGKYNLNEVTLRCNNEEKAKEILTKTLCISEKIIKFR